MKSVSAAALSIVAAMLGMPPPTLDVPRDFEAEEYVSGLPGARELAVHDDGTLTLRSGADRLEISPMTADAPITVMRVATELAAPAGLGRTARAVGAPSFVRMHWNGASGELRYALAPATGASIPVQARTLALARRLARQPSVDVALAPDGSLFCADSRTGAVWRIRRTN